MSDLLGFTSIALVSMMTLFLGLLRPSIFKILLVALIVRVIVMLIGHYFVTLPDSTADAISFERDAWEIVELSQGSFFTTFARGSYYYLSSEFIKWIVAIPYSLFGRSFLMAKSMSMFFGIGSVFLGWKVAKMIWDKQTANKVAWVIALFPSFILYSVIVMREAYIVFFLLVALYGVVTWVKKNNYKSFVLAVLGFILATLFHGALLLGGLTFLVIVGIICFIKLCKSLINNRINIKIFMFFSMFIIILSLYISGKISVPYLGAFKDTTNLKVLLKKTDGATRGEAAYPEWTKAQSFNELLYKGPIRSLYFVFSPFPWDVKKPVHLIGMLDSFIYIYLTFLIFQNRKIIWKDPVLRIILIILLSYIVIFGVGVGNFGTGIRHRSKFAIMFILLAAPLIKRLIFIKKPKKI